MKNKIRYIFTILIIILCSGCTNYNYINQTAEGNKQAEIILNCFDKNDVETLRKMFCKRVTQEYDIEKQIGEAMKLYDGESLSYDKIVVSGGEGIDSGVVIDNHIEYSIKNIKTSKNSAYKIITHSYLVYQKDPDCVGITYLKLIDQITNEEIQIGEFVY